MGFSIANGEYSIGKIVFSLQQQAYSFVKMRAYLMKKAEYWISIIFDIWISGFKGIFIYFLKNIY
jgi:hypothetical protein